MRQWLTRLFSTRKRSVTKSELVGLYLSQTNSRDHYSGEAQQNRQRRNGRYSHTRERA